MDSTLIERNNYDNIKKILLTDIINSFQIQGENIAKFKIKELSGKEMLIIDIVSLNKSTIFFVYSDLNCQSCIDKEIHKIMNLPNIDEYNIHILAHYRNKNSLGTFLRLNQIPFKMFSIVKDDLWERFLGIAHKPCYLIVDECGRIEKVFFSQENMHKPFSITKNLIFNITSGN